MVFIPRNICGYLHPSEYRGLRAGSAAGTTTGSGPIDAGFVGYTLRGVSFAVVETVFTAFGDGPDPVENQPVLQALGRLMPAILQVCCT